MKSELSVIKLRSVGLFLTLMMAAMDDVVLKLWRSGVCWGLSRTSEAAMVAESGVRSMRNHEGMG